jgi:hypothetical protein
MITLNFSLQIFTSAALAAENVNLVYSIEIVDSNQDLIIQRNVYVEENKVKYLIEPNTRDWYYHHYYKEIYKILDLDGDGIDEAIIWTHGSGNCCGDEYLIIKRIDEGFYTVIEDNELSLVDLEIRHTNEKTILVARDTGDGAGNTSLEETIAYLELVNGELKLIEKHYNTAWLPAEIQITSKELEEKQKYTFSHDIDIDGKQDEIVCNYWDRWGDASCKITSSRFGEVKLPISCDRFGVMASVTNSMHDLVCDRTFVMSWDQTKSEYIIDEK